MRVGIVGAGIAGLAAARDLTAAGHEVLLFEKSAVVGGRVATEQIGDYVFDPGATSIAPRSMSIQNVMLSELDQKDLVKVLLPIYVHSYLRVAPGDDAKNATVRYTYKHGNAQFPALLAESLDVRLKCNVDEIEKLDQTRFRVNGEDFDAVVLTPPIPQSATLLWSLNESRAFANCRYRSCLSVMLGFKRELPPTHYHALLDPEQRHPLIWLSLENVKCPGRAPTGCSAMVAQLSPAFSLANFERPNEHILENVLDYIVRLYGSEWTDPVVSTVRRWKYSQPEGYALFESVNRPGSRLLIASDGLGGGRVEQAYEAGARAARMLNEEA